MRRSLVIASALLTIGLLADCGSPKAAAPARPAVPPAELAFGAPASVMKMTITPTQAWWFKSDGHLSDEKQNEPENGRFLVVEMKVTPTAAHVEFPAPALGGPQIISHERQYADDSASDNVVWNTCLPFIDSGQPMTPGQTLVAGETFDVPAGAAKLVLGSAAWKVPTASTSPVPANVREAIRTGNGC